MKVSTFQTGNLNFLSPHTCNGVRFHCGVLNPGCLISRFAPLILRCVNVCVFVCVCVCVCVCGCAWDTEPRSGKGRLTRRKSQTPLQQRERALCHNLCLKKHEFFSAQWQRWHFMFTTIISLVNDSCGCGAYESFREQTETLMLRALSFFAGCRFNIQSESLGTKQTAKWVWE